MLATAELLRRRTLHSKQFNLTAAKLACFRESVESDEVLLRQRMADRELRSLYGIADVGVPRQSEQQSPMNKLPESSSLKIYGEF